MGSEKYATSETAAGVFSRRADPPAQRVRRRPPPPPSTMPARAPVPQPELIEPARPAYSPVVPENKPIRWFGRNASAAPAPATPQPLAADVMPPPDPVPPRPPPLSVTPLRTPAPPVTFIRVMPVPVEGFEYETASLWRTEPPQVVEVPPIPAAAVAPASWQPPPPPEERPTLTWLDEDPP